ERCDDQCVNEPALLICGAYGQREERHDVLIVAPQETVVEKVAQGFVLRPDVAFAIEARHALDARILLAAILALPEGRVCAPLILMAVETQILQQIHSPARPAYLACDRL